jgi:hypothetical protein
VNDLRDMPALQAEGIAVDGGSGLRDLLAGSTVAIQRALILMQEARERIAGSDRSPQAVGAERD